MNIVALLPVKNEAWILSSYLSSVSLICDQIIALDDSSTDETREILESAGVTVISNIIKNEKVINMGKRRQLLLDAGRAAGGTHFVWLDADEIFSANFIPSARKIIEALKPGQKLMLRWVHVWKDCDHYLDDHASAFGYIWKDFVVHDTGQDNFPETFLSEARTQGSSSNVVRLPEETGVVLHFQFSRFEITQYKQALYRCIEFLEGGRGAMRINNTYRTTLDNPKLKTKQIPTAWRGEIKFPTCDNTTDVNWYNNQLQALFSKYGIEHFEPLQIWHIGKLNAQFVEITGRQPISKIFPVWVSRLNDIKNKLRYG